MKMGSQFLMDVWRRMCGLPEAPDAERMPPLEELRQTEWSPEFERLMRNRLLMGAFRYGCLGASAKHQYDRVASARRRLDQYEATGNLEHLVDVANLCLVEFEEGDHPRRHFRASDDGEHAKPMKGAGV